MKVDEMMILVRALALLLGLFFTLVIKPAIDNYVGKDKVDEFLGYIKVAIRCAEQIFTPEQWAEKKNYVYKYAIEKAAEMGIEIADTDIDVLIEGFVNEIKRG